MQIPVRSSSPENSTPTGLRTAPAARASRIAAIAPLVSALPRPCSRDPRRTSKWGGDISTGVRGDGVHVGVEQQPRGRAAEARVHVGVVADRNLLDRGCPKRAQLRRQTVDERTLLPVGILGVERDQLREPIGKRHSRGYTMVDAP